MSLGLYPVLGSYSSLLISTVATLELYFYFQMYVGEMKGKGLSDLT